MQLRARALPTAPPRSTAATLPGAAAAGASASAVPPPAKAPSLNSCGDLKEALGALVLAVEPRDVALLSRAKTADRMLALRAAAGGATSELGALLDALRPSTVVKAQLTVTPAARVVIDVSCAVKRRFASAAEARRHETKRRRRMERELHALGVGHVSVNECPVCLEAPPVEPIPFLTCPHVVCRACAHHAVLGTIDCGDPSWKSAGPQAPREPVRDEFTCPMCRAEVGALPLGGGALRGGRGRGRKWGLWFSRSAGTPRAPPPGDSEMAAQLQREGSEDGDDGVEGVWDGADGGAVESDGEEGERREGDVSWAEDGLPTMDASIRWTRNMERRHDRMDAEAAKQASLRVEVAEAVHSVREAFERCLSAWPSETAAARELLRQERRARSRTRLSPHPRSISSKYRAGLVSSAALCAGGGSSSR
jgi:hypothetical protein